MAKFVCFFVIELLSAQATHAGLVLEPYAGSGFGAWSMDRTKSAMDMELGGKSSNVVYGARLNWTFNYFYVGFDLQYDSVLWRYQKVAAYSVDDSWNTNSKAVETGAGPVIGLKTPGNTFFAWFSLFLNDRLKFSSDLDPSEPAPLYHGSGANAGLSFRLTRFFQVGAEYQMKRFTKMGQNSQVVDLPGTSVGGANFSELKYNVIFAFISVPIEFF